MNEKLTEMVFILDRSGSMRGMEKDTIGGFNSLIEKQKEVEGKAFVSTVLFSHNTEILHDRVNLSDVKPMSEKDFRVMGTTALMDALGGAIDHIGMIHKYAREEDVPAHTLFVIMTDGMENASHRYSSDKVKQMVKNQQEKYGWEFIFLGANIDAVETAAQYGIGCDDAVTYLNDTDGVSLNYTALEKRIRMSRVGSPCRSADWKREIEADVLKRGRR